MTLANDYLFYDVHSTVQSQYSTATSTDDRVIHQYLRTEFLHTGTPMNSLAS